MRRLVTALFVFFPLVAFGEKQTVEVDVAGLNCVYCAAEVKEGLPGVGGSSIRSTIRFPAYSCRAAESSVRRTTSGSSRYEGIRTTSEGAVAGYGETIEHERRAPEEG